MRNFDEFKEELLHRKQQRKEKDRRKKRVIGCICLLLCLCITVGVFMWPTTKVQALNLMKNIRAQDVPGKEPDEAFRNAQYRFALELFKACRAEDGENVLVSPLSVMLALSMTANGAAGETLAQMETVLGLSITELNAYLKTYVSQLPSNFKSKLHIVNSIWFNEGLEVNRDFLQTNANYYGADAYASPFDEQTVKDINTWVEENTGGMIDKILERIDTDAVMYLVNAMYFDAGWEGKTPKTDSGKFYLADETVQDVTVMNTTAQYYLETENAVGLMKDYAGKDYRFVAICPKNVSLEEFISDLTAEKLYQMLNEAQEAEVYTSIPEFSCDKTYSMEQMLRSMGMTAAFDAQTADLTDIAVSPEGNLYIGSVTHKTSITVNSDGTKAAAATVITDNVAGEPDYFMVWLTRPFLYMIVDSENNLPLFIGAVDRVN